MLISLPQTVLLHDATVLAHRSSLNDEADITRTFLAHRNACVIDHGPRRSM
jgi:hypothetical protein